MPAPPAAVWTALNDPGVLQRCIPGCEAVEALSATERSARLAVKMGPVRAKFAGKVSLRDIEPERACRMVFEGSGGAAGFARGESSITLTGKDGGTEVGYTVDASIGGRLGQIGGRLLDTAARGMADEFFNKLAAEWAPPPGPDTMGAVEGPSEGPMAGSSSASAAMPGASMAGASTADAAVAEGRGPAPQRSLPGVAQAASASAVDAVERLRVKWFVLGAAATGFGVALARLLG
jgi:carbon monoxide dehydrogenase subunit G